MKIFTQTDEKNSGKVSKKEWMNTMRSVSHLSMIPWRLVLPFLATVDEDGMIDYNLFLSRYRIACIK
jgi:hypothetical protein